ncbi:MAG TPA: sugar kinase, partial [Kineosporiaceae bacterium]|nr:sugar kinase [Kineosporiaceae bacterium]
ETMASFAAAGIGPLRHQPVMHLHVGGAESNVAISLARLGGAATWIGRVGDDELGDLVLTALRGEGVDVRHAVRDPGAPTGLMVKSRRTSTVGRVAYYRKGSAGSRLEPADLPVDVLRAAGVLHVTGITPALSASARAATFAAAEEARAAGVPVSLDVNHRSALWSAEEAGAVLADLAGRTDVLFTGDDEAELLGATGSPEQMVEHLAALGPAQVVLKRGSRGALALLDGDLVQVPAFPVAVVDAVGAGDAFVGGYLAELLLGADPATRLRTAAACGAFACTVPGDWEGLPTRRELQLLTTPEGTVVR